MKEQFMELAIKEAIKSTSKNEVPVGAVIVKNNIVISKAHNLTITNNSPVAHAEILAIELASKALNNWRLDGCDIYVTKEPCVMCMGAIASARINNVYFGAYEKNLESWKANEIFAKQILNHKVNAFGGILEEKCSRLLSEFFKAVR